MLLTLEHFADLQVIPPEGQQNALAGRLASLAPARDRGGGFAVSVGSMDQAPFRLAMKAAGSRLKRPCKTLFLARDRNGRVQIPVFTFAPGQAVPGTTPCASKKFADRSPSRRLALGRAGFLSYGAS
jgi:hypothetical protein